MLQEATINGRPALVAFIDEHFNPVDEADAKAARVIFTDADGGSMTIVVEPEDEKTQKYYGEKPGERDEAGRFGAGGGSGASDGEGISAGRAGKTTLGDFKKAGLEVKGFDKKPLEGAEADKFIDRWNDRVGMSPGDFRDRMVGPNSEMGLSWGNDELWMIGALADENKNTIGQCANVIDFNKNEVNVTAIKFEDAEQGKGHAKRLMADQIATYQEMGLDRANLIANVTLGGYAWARYGFVPANSKWAGDIFRFRDPDPQPVLDAMPNADRAKVMKLFDSAASNPRAIWAIADSPYGKKLLGGSSWEGALNFDDARSMRRFNAYIGGTAKSEWKYYGEKPGERDEGGKFSSGGGGAAEKPTKPSKSSKAFFYWDTKREFDESKHPRNPKGEFTSAGGGGASGGVVSGDGWKIPANAKHPGEGYSPNAYEKDDKIFTNNVYDAQRALNEGRKVELDQPDTLSTLIDKLGETAKDMIAKGEKAPVYDLCKVTVTGTNLFCAETLGLARIEMPQLRKELKDKFIEHLFEQGYKVDRTEVLASHLRATQNQLDGVSVAQIANGLRSGAKQMKPIVVSQDNYVLDGHHNWGAKIGLDAAGNKLETSTKMPVVRIGVPIVKLLEEAEKFTGGAGKVGVGEHPGYRSAPLWEMFDVETVLRVWGREVRSVIRQRANNFDESRHPRDQGGKFTTGGGGSAASGEGGHVAVGPKAKTKLSDFKKAGIATKTSIENVEGPKPDQAAIDAANQKFIDRWNKSVGMEPGDFKDRFLAGSKGKMELTYDVKNDSLYVDGELTDKNGEKAGEYENTIEFKNNLAHIGRLVLEKTGAGQARPLLASQIALYQELGLEKATLLANIEIGSYAWAKYGFVPTQKAWDGMEDDLRKDIYEFARGDDRATLLELNKSNNPKTIWAISDNQYGKQILSSRHSYYPIDRSWNGELKFDDKQSMKRFNAYVSRKPKKKKALELLRYYGEKPGERDEGGKFSAGGGGGGSASGEGVAVGPKPKATFKDFENAGIAVMRLMGAEADQKFLDRWNNEIGIDPAEFKERFLAGSNGTMKLDHYHRGERDLLHIDGFLQDENGNRTGEYSNTIDFNNNSAHMTRIVLKKTDAGQAKSLIGNQVGLYQEIGLEETTLYADMDVGSYAWARYGFVPTEESWGDIKSNIKKDIKENARGKARDTLLKLADSSNPKAIWAIADRPEGKSVLKGKDERDESKAWDGALNFSDKASMKRFNAYVAKGAKKAFLSWETKREFDESKHPRGQPDNAGQFVSGGGGGADGEDKPAAAGRPTPTAGSGSSEKAMQKVQAAIAAIPAAHAEILKDIPVEIVWSSEEIKKDRDTLGTFTYDGDKAVGIKIAETMRMDVHQVYDLPVENIEGVTIHELGHALDHHHQWNLGKDVKFLKGVNLGLKRMTSKEKRNALNFLGDPRERVAELYALAYNPSKSAKYFGGMTRQRAEKVFAESLAVVKAL